MLETYLLPGGWVIKCHFLEQNEAALCNASAEGFALDTGWPLILPDTPEACGWEDALLWAVCVKPLQRPHGADCD